MLILVFAAFHAGASYICGRVASVAAQAGLLPYRLAEEANSRLPVVHQP